MVDDLKSEGPGAAEKYMGNEAFMLKLRKIIRNVVPQREMDRITHEVQMRRHQQRFAQMTAQIATPKTVQEEDEDAKAWAAMMREMTGESPAGPSTDIVVGQSVEKVPDFSTDDEAALQAMMAVMSRKPGDSLDKPPSPANLKDPEVSGFQDDDAIAWEQMMAVMNRKPSDSQPMPMPIPMPMPEEDRYGDEDAAVATRRSVRQDWKNLFR